MRNLESYYKALSFDPIEHAYTAHGETYPSVSGMITRYYHPFDTWGKANEIAARDGVDAKALVASWKMAGDLACEKGTDIHNFAERYVADKYNMKSDAMISDNYWPEYEVVKKLWDSVPDYYVPAALELRMFSEQFSYAGTADVIVYDKRDDTYVIMDYKTNKKLFSVFNDERMLAPFDALHLCNFNKYQLQFSFYQLLFESTTGLKVSGRKLIHIQPDDFTIYDTEDYSQILKDEILINLNDEDDDE